MQEGLGRPEAFELVLETTILHATFSLAGSDATSGAGLAPKQQCERLGEHLAVMSPDMTTLGAATEG